MSSKHQPTHCVTAVSVLCPIGRGAALAAAVLVAVGCGRPATSLKPGDAPRPVDRAAADPRDRTDALLADMARYVYAAAPVAGGSQAEVRLITFGPFVNRTDVSTERFARFRESFQDALKRRSRSHGLLFADMAPQSRPPRYELQASALPMGADAERLLLRLALHGPDRRDQRAIIWSDNLILPKP